MTLDEVVYRVAVFDNANIASLRKPLQDMSSHIKVVYDRIERSFGKDKQEELAELMQSYNGAVVRSDTWFKEALTKLPNLRFVARAGIGVNNIDDLLCSKNGVIIFYAPNSNSTAVSEMDFAQLLGYERRPEEQNRRLQDGEEEKAVKETSLGRELYGKRMAVVGTGNIGAKAIAIGLGFKMNFNVYDEYKSPEETMARISREMQDRNIALANYSAVNVTRTLEEALENVDYVQVHVNLNESTRHLINSARIARMNDGAVLINNSREGIVDEQAVKDALDSGKLRAYITDVLEKKSVLKNDPRVFKTAHTGGSTEESQDKANQMVGESIAAFARSNGKEVIRSYNYPTIDDSLRDPYNLTRVLAAFATQYLRFDNREFQSVRIIASGMPSYNPVALKMAGSAGTAFSLNKLNGNSDLPALSILSDLGISVESEQIEAARPGVPSRITLEYKLNTGETISFTGQVDAEAAGNLRYTIKSIGNFTGRGTEIIPLQYVLVEHRDVEGSLGKTALAIAAHNFNIERGQTNFGGRNDMNLIVYPVQMRGPLNPNVPRELLATLQKEIGDSGRVTLVDLRQYHSPH